MILVKNYVAYLIVISVLFGIVPGFPTALAQYVPFKVPFLTVNTEVGPKNLTEAYTRVAIADPGRPINGVYINLAANNSILDFVVGETIQVSGLDPAYFGGLMLKIFLVKGNVVKIPSGSEFLNINFTGTREALFSTNDLETSQIKLKFSLMWLGMTIPLLLWQAKKNFIIMPLTCE